MALKTNLISWWTLDETSGTRNDSHGSNHLTDYNTVTYTTGKKSNAASFASANSEYLSITDASQTGLDISTTGTWSYWIYFVSDTDAVVIDKTAAGSSSYWIQHQIGTGTTQRFSNSAETGLDITATMNTGTWYHCVWTYNAGTVEFFLNGTSQGTASGGTSLTNSTAPFTLGRVNKYTGNYLNGYMDEVGVWSRVLTGAEITELYNSGNGMTYSELDVTATFTPRISFIM